MHPPGLSTAPRPETRPGAPVPEAAPPYADNGAHLAAELAWLELAIQALLARASSPPAADAGPESLRGLYLSDAEMQSLLAAPAQADNPALRHAQAQARALAAEIAARRAASLAAEVPLRLPLLGRLFGLDEWEERLLLACLAPIIDQRYEKFYAYLNDDLTRKGPTLHLVAALLLAPLTAALDAHLRLRGALAVSNRVFRAGLVRVVDEDHAASRMSCVLRLDERIAGFLLGDDALPGQVETFAHLVDPVASPPDAVLAQRLAAAVRDHLDDNRHTQSRRLLIPITGRPGTGRHALAEAVCAQLGMPLVVIDLAELDSLGPPFEPVLRLAAREGLLQPAALYFQHYDLLYSASGESGAPPDAPAGTSAAGADRLAALLRAIEDFSWLTFLAGEQPLQPPDRYRRHVWLPVELAAPDEAGRAVCWQRALAEVGIELSSPEIDALAGRFRLTAGHIRAALRAAGDEALLRPPDQRRITAPNLARACRHQATPRLPGLAQRIEPRASWPDLVLPADSLVQLHELCGQVRQRRTVYGTWGFGDKLARGKGLAALFSGPSGTGKTMAAEIIAGDLELDLYRIDLSTVVSKYIGETEKNLSRIFAEAERGSVLLFFDEADALFGKRSEVKDAHDRYANIEISYLLQRIETYEGVVILATNLKKNMDDAFLRRLQFTIEFPFPDVAQRRRIWEGLFPTRAPRAPDVDLDFLAEHLPLAGGNIKNVVLHAAFLAADEGRAIGMPHLMRAARREYDKIGRLGGESDFGPYWSLVAVKEG